MNAPVRGTAHAQLVSPNAEEKEEKGIAQVLFKAEDRELTAPLQSADSGIVLLWNKRCLRVKPSSGFLRGRTAVCPYSLTRLSLESSTIFFSRASIFTGFARCASKPAVSASILYSLLA
jgi:hypothetical protein